MAERNERTAAGADRKMVFFDIDGTLVDTPTQRIPQSTVKAIQRLRENGHLAFVNSGRTYASIEKRIKEIGFDGYVCGCGTRIYYRDRELFSVQVSAERCMEIIGRLRQFRISAFFERPECVYYDAGLTIENPAMEKMKNAFVTLGMDLKPLPEKESVRFDKFFCVLSPESDLIGFEAGVEDFYGTPQGPGYREFVQTGCSKAEAIFFLQKKLEVAPQNCYAIGDSPNDLSMLKAVPNSIAMGVCAPEILPWCSYQTAPVLEDGIEKALCHFGLI